MRARTPRTSAELALEAHAQAQHARRRGTEPQRQRLENGYGALLLDGVLPPGHPLEDTPADIRRKRVEQERRKRGL